MNAKLGNIDTLSLNLKGKDTQWALRFVENYIASVFYNNAELLVVPRLIEELENKPELSLYYQIILYIITKDTKYLPPRQETQIIYAPSSFIESGRIYKGLAERNIMFFKLDKES